MCVFQFWSSGLSLLFFVLGNSKHTLESACGCPQKYLLQFLLELHRISGSAQPTMLTTSHIWIMIPKLSLIWVPWCYKHKTYIGFEDLVPPQKYFSQSVQSLSCVWLRPCELQHARPPCPSPTPGVQSDSHPSSQWCHPAISSSVVPFSSVIHLY